MDISEKAKRVSEILNSHRTDGGDAYGNVVSTVMQKEWVAANCVLAILFLVFTFMSDHYLQRKRKSYYSRMSGSDKLWILANINVVGLYVLVIVPFSYIAAKLTFGSDPFGDMIKYRRNIVFGLNSLSVSFLFEGVLVASIKRNVILFTHHVVFFCLVLAFSLTESLDVLRTGMVLGSLTTWQVFPRLLAVYRGLGIRFRKQKTVAYLAVVIGIFTRGFLGPLGLGIILSQKFKSLDLQNPVDIMAFLAITACDLALVYVEVHAVIKHRQAYVKVVRLARESVLGTLKTLSQSTVLRNESATKLKKTLRELGRASVQIFEKPLIPQGTTEESDGNEKTND